jgi:hypothetical protein
VYAGGQHDRWDEDYTPVSKQLLEHLIGVLRGHVARWEWSQGAPDEARAYYELMASTCTALGGVIAVEAAQERYGGAREIVLLIQNFLQLPQAGEYVDAVRDDRDVDSAVIETLKGLHWQIQKRRMGELATQRPKGDQRQWRRRGRVRVGHGRPSTQGR